jgi:type I restriction enzyme S subunit|uniref:restriction endonuclease subunit S n=1 Tax=Ruminococcus bromii TaxID=40518 RepID=UPI003FD83781
MKSKCKLGDIISQRREKYNGENLPICGVTRDGFIPPKQKDADLSLYNVFYKDDFVFNPARMELNAIVFNDIYEKAICSSLYEIFYVSKPDIVLPSFLALLVKQAWFTRYCEFLGSGSAREYCRVVNISEIEIEYPDLDEQRRIVNEYDVIRNRIALKRRINDNLEAIAQSVFQEQFASFYRSDELPNGYSFAGLDSICTVKGGKRLPADCELLDTPTKHPYIRVRDVGNSRYVCLTDQFQYIDEETHSAISRYIVNTDDIIISIVGTIGLLGKIHSSLDNANLTENCVKLTNIHTVTSDYLYYTLCYKKQAKEIELLTVGAVQAKLPIYNIQSIKILVPPKEAIEDFQNKLNVLNEQIEANTIEINKLYELQSLFLAKLSD